MTSVSDTESSKFLNATNVILAFEDGSSTSMDPNSDINAITFDEGKLILCLSRFGRSMILKILMMFTWPYFPALRNSR